MKREVIQSLLHAPSVPHRYETRAGEWLTIKLPRVPLTRHTEYLRVEMDAEGAELQTPDTSLEGSVLPRTIEVRPIAPGEAKVVFRAIDSRTRLPIADVDPLEITLHVEK